MKMSVFITYWNNFVHFPFSSKLIQGNGYQNKNSCSHLEDYLLNTRKILKTRATLAPAVTSEKHYRKCLEINKCCVIKVSQDGSVQHILYNYIFSHQHSCGYMNHRTLQGQRNLACGETDISIRRVIFCARHLNFHKTKAFDELFKTSFSSKITCPCFFYLAQHKQITFKGSIHNLKIGNRHELFVSGKIFKCYLFYVFSNILPPSLEQKKPSGYVPSVHFSCVAQLCPSLCDRLDCSTSGLPVHHQLPELAQTHAH